MHLNITITFSLFNEIHNWTWGDFRKQFKHGGQSNTKTSRAFVNETQWNKTCSAFKSTWQAKHRGGVSPQSKCSCVRYVCSILNLWIIISSRRGKRNILITFTHDSLEYSLFQFNNSNVVATTLLMVEKIEIEYWDRTWDRWQSKTTRNPRLILDHARNIKYLQWKRVRGLDFVICNPNEGQSR